MYSLTKKEARKLLSILISLADVVFTGIIFAGLLLTLGLIISAKKVIEYFYDANSLIVPMVFNDVGTMIFIFFCCSLFIMFFGFFALYVNNGLKRRRNWARMTVLFFLCIQISAGFYLITNTLLGLKGYWITLIILIDLAAFYILGFQNYIISRFKDGRHHRMGSSKTSDKERMIKKIHMDNIRDGEPPFNPKTGKKAGKSKAKRKKKS